MLRGFYTAASGILMQERSLGVLTNNMANSQTPGFRASRVVSTTFEHEYLTRLEKQNSEGIGKGAPIRIVSDVPTLFDPGSLEETERPFDLAINGEGFFNIQTEDAEGTVTGQYLTRNGNFDIDEQGFLILRGRGKVLGEKGPIQLKGSDFIVGFDGTVTEGDREIDRILITQPPAEAELEVNQEGMYTLLNMEQNLQLNPEETMLVQGWVERSNIDLNREMSLVMEAQRAFQACSSALQIVDKINQKAATQIASL